MENRQVVYVSQSLKWKDHGNPVFEQLQQILGNRLKVLPISNEWCRDYLPVKGAHGKHVLFKYAPTYLIGDKTHEKTIPLNLPSALNKLGIAFETSEVVLDGGGIVMHGDIAIVTDRVISENATAWYQEKPNVLKDIRDLLGLKKLIVVPADPFDITGHADGTVRFIDSKTVLINDPMKLYEVLETGDSIHQLEMYNRWIKNLEQTLKDAGFRIEYLPSLMHLEEKPNSAWGIYLNFLELDDMILVPFFRKYDETNHKVKAMIEKLYGKDVHGVYADELSKEGGIINCCTWQYCE
jgi:agmatine deiminase